MAPATSAVRRVPKLAGDSDRFKRRLAFFDSARAAMAAFFQAVGAEPGARVLVPAYIASGVMEPLAALRLGVGFYRVQANLEIDLAHLQELVERERPTVVVVIHFFGHVDPNYEKAVGLCREAGAWVLEDEAHALFTDLVNGASGRLGHAAVFSLHKLLPVPTGGALVANAGEGWLLDRLGALAPAQAVLWEQDLVQIADRRRANVSALYRLLLPLSGDVDPLWPTISDTDVLQTFPVVVRSVNRDRLHAAMNEDGYGVVSLYYQLVEEIAEVEHPLSHALSRTVLNLPVHQDLTPSDLEALVDHLGEVVSRLREAAAR